MSTEDTNKAITVVQMINENLKLASELATAQRMLAGALTSAISLTSSVTSSAPFDVVKLMVEHILHIELGEDEEDDAVDVFVERVKRFNGGAEFAPTLAEVAAYVYKTKPIVEANYED